MNKKSLKKRCIAGLLVLFIAVVMTGCSGDKKADSSTEEPKGVLYPVVIDDTEIRIGETTVQALLDKGFKVTVSDSRTVDGRLQIDQYEIEPESELEANSYYSGGSIWITDSTFAHISMVTDESKIKMGDAVIARLEFNISSDDEEAKEKIKFNGVPVSEISREKAGEMFPDFTGDDNMWFSKATETDYKYFMSFSMEDKLLAKLEIEKGYDVDWNSKN